MKIETILNFARKLIPKKIFRKLQPTYHLLLAISGNLRYRFPGRKMIVIGVTGTNGKSTTVELINSVLKAGGFKTGMISTVAFEVDGRRIINTTNRTTLGRWQTQKKLAGMVDAGCTHAVIEVASEGIAWHRVWGIPFDCAVFTNLSPEHLNFHKTMENYRNTKGKLFSNLAKSKDKGFPKTIIVNADDKEYQYFSSFSATKKISYGLNNGDIWATNIIAGKKNEFEIVDENEHFPVKSELLGNFNIYNMLAAYATGKAFQIEANKIIKGLEGITGIEGRMEEINSKTGFRAFIDYAVTPESFELLFRELRKLTKGKLIAVFGATGDRDKTKRPKMGEVAARLTDYIILTDEEPYSENPAVIIDMIAEGAYKVRKKNIELELDRKKAICKAIDLASEGDTIVVTGMGHQKYRNIGGTKKMPWDEAKIIKELIETKDK